VLAAIDVFCPDPCCGEPFDERIGESALVLHEENRRGADRIPG
jgi:hypothetical protein